MPFDGVNFEKKAAVFSLDGLIAWLETQDPATGYSWGDACDCLFNRYGSAMGLTDKDAYLAAIRGVCQSMGINDLTEPGDIAIDYPHTYGAALARAREIKASIA